MPIPIILFVRAVDAVNHFVGRFSMYLLFVMAAVMLYATVSRVAFHVPVNWALEMTQFLLSAYYLLGGAYTLQMGGHVRMDLVYMRLTPRGRAVIDAITILFVIFYLVFLFAGGVSATNYAVVYKQQNYTSWAPLLWPIKLVMTAAIFMMLLQCIASFIKDIALARGKPIE